MVKGEREVAARAEEFEDLGTGGVIAPVALERDGGRGGGGLLEGVEGFVRVVDPDEVEPGAEALGEFVGVVGVGDTLADDVDVMVAVVADLASEEVGYADVERAEEGGAAVFEPVADRVGASREMVARILKDLAIGDYISFEGKNIIINGKLPSSY